MQLSPVVFKASLPQTQTQNQTQQTQAAKTDNKQVQTNSASKKTEIDNKKSNGNIFKELGISEPPPITIGIASAFVWTGLGMLIDKGMSKILKYQFNPKMSFKMNAIFGLVMGAFDFYKAKKG